MGEAKRRKGIHTVGRDAEVAAAFCGHCGSVLDAVTPMDSRKATPKPGDWTVCLVCAGFLRFDEHAAPKRPTDLDLTRLANDNPYMFTTLRRAQMAARAMPSLRRPPPREAEPAGVPRRPPEADN